MEITNAASKWADQVLRKPSHAALHRRSRCLYLDAASVGFESFHPARRTLTDYEIMAMVGNGQTSAILANDMPTQSAFVAALFRAAA